MLLAGSPRPGSPYPWGTSLVPRSSLQLCVHPDHHESINMVGKMTEYWGCCWAVGLCRVLCTAQIVMPQLRSPIVKQCTVTTNWRLHHTTRALVLQAKSTKRALCIFAAVGRDKRGSSKQWS